MASVRLDFVPPMDDNIVEMKIYESTVPEGPFTEIESVAMSLPYISEYTTDQAAASNNWFNIEFIDDKGAVSSRSQAIQGGTSTLVGEIKDRVMQRNPSMSETTVVQVAEAVIEKYFNADPYSIDPNTVSYAVKEGLTLLTLAYGTQVSSSSGTTESYTAGLVSQKSEASSAESESGAILALAWKWLGISQSRIAQMAEIPMIVATNPVEKDQSRLLLTELP